MIRQRLRSAIMYSGGEALDRIHMPLGRRAFERSVARAGDHALVSIGAGRVRLPGWINTDVSRHAEAYLDLTKPWPLRGSRVARIYGDNVIEHFDLATGRTVLRNCYDALAIGGRIRLATPDVERTARAYLDRSELGAAHLERHRRHGKVAEHPVDLLRVTFAEEEHWAGYCYDFASLRIELERAGFTNVERVDPGQSTDPTFRNLEQRAEGSEIQLQLVVEATRT